MPTKDKKFNKKLKNCKSLQDYVDLAEEYNIEKWETICPKYRARIIRRSHDSKNLIEN